MENERLCYSPLDVQGVNLSSVHTAITSANPFPLFVCPVRFHCPLNSHSPSLIRVQSHESLVPFLQVIFTHLLFAADSGQCGSLAAQLIIAHAGPTEGTALRNMFQPSQQAARGFCHFKLESTAKAHPGRNRTI